MWTQDALRSSAAPWRGRAWRVVELQSKAVTMGLTHSLEDQTVLEQIIEETKPPFPPECAGLHWLLATPFRYAPYPHGSRLRRAGQREGVFYCSRLETTALAEAAFYIYLFAREAPGMVWPANGVERTAFQVAVAAPSAVDLTAAPFDAQAGQWRDLTDYSACQAFADAARSADIAAIHYASVRDPHGGLNLALLTPSAFARPTPDNLRTWRLYLNGGVRALREFPVEKLEFSTVAWASDSRLAAD